MPNKKDYICMPFERRESVVNALKSFLETCEYLGGSCPVAFREARDKGKEALYILTGEDKYKPHYIKS